MRSVADFVEILGFPIRSDSEDVCSVGAGWGIEFPSDFCEIAGAYGDATISEYIFFCGARRLEKYAMGMGRKLEQSRKVPELVLPSPGGALVWGNTLEGDQFFLVPRKGGKWTVSAFRRGWGDWYESDLEFSEWFYAALAGEIATDWLPEWGKMPHAVRPMVER
ncbi:hypothetical protein AB0K51_15630 [Kitasatospora sp. NPDC049285]|uniref:hypothetical protein n=1 Tax=Kitasatospora sp. NPDC049285 TaxID=3157096 RepID=UPI00343B9EC5